MRAILGWLVVPCAVVALGCGDDDDGAGGSGGSAGSGGTEADAGNEAGNGGSGGADAAAVDAGGGATGECPQGTYCETAPEGVDGFACASLEGLPFTTCTQPEDCNVGECKYGNCIQECELTDCPQGFECTEGIDYYRCTLADTGQFPKCETQEDCDIGRCQGPETSSYCMQLCEPEGGIPEKVSVSGQVTGFAPALAEGFEPVPIEGAEVCVHDDDSVPCVTSGSDGSYTLNDVPAQQEVLLTFTKDGYESSVVRLWIPTRDTVNPVPTPIISEDLSVEAQTTTGITRDETRGGIIIATKTREIAPDASTGYIYRLEGVTVSLDPESGEGPFYIDAVGKIDLSLEATSEYGQLTFMNVEPGDYTVTFSHATLECGDVAATVVAGHIAISVIGYCTASN